jgi:hypothetical protein
MQPGTPTFPCPNCGRPLPPHARFCGDCGRPVAQAQAAAPAQPVFPSPALSPAAQPRPEDLATVADPNFPLSASAPAQAPTVAPPAAPPASTPALAGWYPPQQTAAPAGFSSQDPTRFNAPVSAFPGLAPTTSGAPALGSQLPAQFPPAAEFPRRRSFLSKPAGKIALLFLVIAVLGGGVGVFFILRGLGSSPAADLPSDVPLPANSTFVKKVDQTWYYTVADTTPQQVQDFYQTQLPNKGWQEPNILGNAAGTALFACKSDQEVKIVSDASTSLGGVAPPGGGVVLKIVLQPPAQADCSV